ncbi:Planctomycete cytochrome C [Stieleria bergensis]|uniref:Planctomycete cytochrome C n=2 Tax=Stieleria bergensis TaxID=2528025 RepID=A0A517T2Z5_9BACT|nr:Planctomycete cytochrome C [Planctomycetes bacterium SV_7m_r]
MHRYSHSAARLFFPPTLMFRSHFGAGCRLWHTAIIALGVAAGCLGRTGADEPSAAEPPNALLFESSASGTSVQSILANRCGKCHSETVRKGALNLAKMEGIRTGGETGEDLIADTLDDSYLWTVIDNGEMPPDDQPPLTDPEIEQIKNWIQVGGQSSNQNQTTKVTLDHHDVTPILLLRCNTCHGPQRTDGGLDLRSRESMLTGGDSGPAMVVGQADSSLMIKRIESQQCPPSESLLKFFVRRPSETEIKTLRQWIDSGAKLSTQETDRQGITPDLLVTDQDRQHWAFQPIQPPTHATSIDSLIADKLIDAGLKRSPAAGRDTLIRRAYLDLTGLPPSWQEYQRWHHHQADDWDAQMIDHLLDSPRYGERWGRYWLDLAGYADSEGGISADPLRPLAWKYRDYVIDAFNRDLPYDRFLIEQLAGDELIDVDQADKVTAEMVNNLVATGFLRMSIDETGSRTMNFVPERLKVIDDALAIVSKGLMGLTMECARCHTHKYDPLPQRDYYRLKAVFQGALDEHDWRTFKNRKLSLATKSQRERIKQINPPLEKQLRSLRNKDKQLNQQLTLQLLRDHYPEQSERDHQETLAALRVADNNRSLKQKRLFERLVTAQLMPPDKQSAAITAIETQIEETITAIETLERQLVPSTQIRALWDQGRPSPTYMLLRGEHDKPGAPVSPGVPAVLTDGETPFDARAPFPEGTPKSGRRLAFAKWLVTPQHPLTARVMVNRIWSHHFGTGLVPTIDNFGVQGSPPTHPELLDFLADSFVKSGWSVKAMHRLIMTSKTYQQSSAISKQTAERDPQNLLYSRMNLRRMDAEALRDSLLQLANRLDVTTGGLPDPVSIDRDGQVTAKPNAAGRWRRSIYLQYRRTEIPSMMDTFDYPAMGPNCLTRNVSTVSPQALLLMNNARVRELTDHFAQRILESNNVHGPIEPLIRRTYALALSRQPDQTELQLGKQAIEAFIADSDGDLPKAWQAYCHTLINSAAFLFVD